jgi:uncharacterized protein
MKTAKYWIEKLNLVNHPEGGWYCETYRSAEIVPKQVLSKGFSGDRSFFTAIYYLLEGNDFSSFHRIKSDEIWHFYTGTSPIEIFSIEERKIRKQILGDDPGENQWFQVVVNKNTWFAARLADKNGFALAGCTVSPGFNYDDFELATKSLVIQFPELESEIIGLIRL